MHTTILLFVLGCITTCQLQEIYYCDFEEDCDGLLFDKYWTVNNVSTHADHTYGNLSGHYITTTDLGTWKPAINFRAKDWIEPPTNMTACLTQWIYSNETKIVFGGELAQGDDLQSRLSAGFIGIGGNNSKWVGFTIELFYADRFIVFGSYFNVSQSIDLDDMSISLCNNSRSPPETKVLECDFDRNLCPELISLSNYSYSWSVIQAKQALIDAKEAPPVDYSVGDETGTILKDNYSPSMKNVFLRSLYLVE